MRGDAQAQVVPTPIATPLPLTFLGLLMATLVVSAPRPRVDPDAQTHQAGCALPAVPVPLQLTAAVFGFHGRSATAATGSRVLAAAYSGPRSADRSSPGAFTPSRAVGMRAAAGDGARAFVRPVSRA